MTRNRYPDAGEIERRPVRTLRRGHALVGGLGVVAGSLYLPASNEYELRLDVDGAERTIRMPADELVSIWRKRPA